MTDEPTPHQLSERIVRLEGELKTSRAENEAMESRIDARLAGMEADMAKRDKDNQRWVVGFGLAQMVLTVAILAAGFAFLGILIGLPG